MVSLPASPLVTIRLLSGNSLADRLPKLIEFVQRPQFVSPAHHPLWLYVLRDGLGHVPFAIEAVHDETTCGFLPLGYLRSTLFGRYLVSLPYLNSGGVIADDEVIRRELIENAVALAQELRVKHLELRHEEPTEHPLLNGSLSSKVHMRLRLPDFPGPLWESLPAKVRNQIRKGEKSGLTVHWGRLDLLPEFYDVFARNMRDLGTPVYGKRFFAAILKYFPVEAELCVVRLAERAVAGALLIHGKGVTEVPSASSLREFNHTSANMLMYWHLLDRAIEREQSIFDFGRSTVNSSTFKFKKQWGAEPEGAVWQYHLRDGNTVDLRPDNPKMQRLIRIWQQMPLGLTRWIGPSIVRGIP